MPHFQCDIAIPSGLRRSRVFARLEEFEPESLTLLAARGLVDATHQVIDAAGQPILTHLSERDPAIATELLRHGFWELPETIAILAAIRPGACILDVGAHIGFYSILMARAARSSGRIYACEPEPENFRTLSANAGLTAQVAPAAATIEPLRLALSNRAGNVRLHRSDRNPAEHSLAAWPDAIDSKVVLAATIDGLRLGDGENPARIDHSLDLIKIDVPSGEFDILRGGFNTVDRDRPLLVVTLRPAHREPEAGTLLLAWLVDHGYETFRLLPPSAADPYQLVCDMARFLGHEEVSDFLRRRPPIPLITLMAFPNATRPALG